MLFILWGKDTTELGETPTIKPASVSMHFVTVGRKKNSRFSGTTRLKEGPAATSAGKRRKTREKYTEQNTDEGKQTEKKDVMKCWSEEVPSATLSRMSERKLDLWAQRSTGEAVCLSNSNKTNLWNSVFYQRVVIVSVAESLIQLPGGVIEGAVPAEESDVSVVTPCGKQLINHQLFPKCIKCL